MITIAAEQLESLQSVQSMKDKVLRGVQTTLAKIESTQTVSSEAEYLDKFMAELRDNYNEKTILGVAIDRPLLRRIFGGSMAVVYIILKETIDQDLQQFQSLAPPGLPLPLSVLTPNQEGADDGDDGDDSEALVVGRLVVRAERDAKGDDMSDVGGAQRELRVQHDCGECSELTLLFFGALVLVVNTAKKS